MASVETGAGHGIHALDLRGFQKLALPPSRQGNQPVLLEGQVHGKVQLGVGRPQDIGAKSQFHAGVSHLPEVGHQFVVSKRRHAYLIHVKHVPRDGIIAFGR